MTAGERMTREEVIGKPTADRKACLPESLAIALHPPG